MNTIKHWCKACDHLHRVPAHLQGHSICCVRCGGGLRDVEFAPARQRRAKEPRAEEPRAKKPAREAAPEPAATGPSPHTAWLKRAAPFMLATLFLAAAALIKLSAGRPIPALASAMFCVLTSLRIFLIYQEEVHGEEPEFAIA